MAHMPIFGQMYFGQIGLTFFVGARETIICRLVMGNLSYYAYFSAFIFYHLWPEMCVATTRAPYGLGPPNPVSRNHVFEIFRGESPLN